MKKLVKFIAVPMMCLAVNFASAANIKDYPTVAVMDFGNKAITSRGLRGHDMTMATEYAIYQLSACGWFDLIDYEQLSTIAKMHSINMSGMIDPSSAVQMGKISGAQFMVIGNVTGLTTKENVAGLRAHNAKLNNAQHVVNANVAVRIVDVETGRIVAAGIGKGSSTSTMTEVGFTKFRNRKVETENIYNSVANTVVNEYSQNKNSSSNSGSSYNNSNASNSGSASDSGFKYSASNSSNSGSASDSGTAFNRGSSYSNSSTNIRESISSVSEQTLRDIESSMRLELDQMAANYRKNSASSNYDNSDWNRNTAYNSSYYASNTYTMPVKNENVTLLGDVNEDGRINETDLELLKQYLVGASVSGRFNTRNADINQDGQITLTDASQLKAYLSGSQGINQPAQGNAAQSSWASVQVSSQGSDGGSNNHSWGNNHTESGSSSMTALSAEAAMRQRAMNASQSSNYDRDYTADHNTNAGYDNTSGYSNESAYNNQSSTNSAAGYNNASEYSNQSSSNNSAGYINNSTSNNENTNLANNSNTFSSSSKNIYYEREAENYSIVIGSVEVSDVQVRNAISKAVRDAIYGNTGIMTTLNNGKKLKIKTGF